MTTRFESPFDMGQRVVVDGDDSLVGTITAFTFRFGDYYVVEVSYVHNGDSKHTDVEPWRLKAAP